MEGRRANQKDDRPCHPCHPRPWVELRARVCGYTQHHSFHVTRIKSPSLELSASHTKLILLLHPAKASPCLFPIEEHR